MNFINNTSRSIIIHLLLTILMDSTQSQTQTQRHIGRVKWFGKGFGFIVDMKDSSKEYFVHHTKLTVNPENDKQTRIYRKLELGEYVSFDVKMEDGKLSAINVTGVLDGPLMCESAALERQSRPIKEQDSSYRKTSYQTPDIKEVSLN